MAIDSSYLPRLRETLDSYSVLYGTPNPPRLASRYRTYVRRVKDSNVTFNRAVAKSLANQEFPELALVVTGSNGRLEGDPSSPVEYIVIGNLPEYVQSIPKLEAKDIARSCLSCYHDDPRRVFPGRILDGIVVGGDERYFDVAKRKLLEEMKNPKMRARVKNKRREYRQIAERGRQTFNGHGICHFDLDKGLAFYRNGQSEASGNGQPASFKYGPLRFVQFRILEELYNLVAKDGGNIVLQLPTNTSERLRWLSDNGLLKLRDSQVEDAIDAYEYFLWLYHISQYSYRQGQNQIEIDKDDVEEERSVLLGLLATA